MQRVHLVYQKMELHFSSSCCIQLRKQIILQKQFMYGLLLHKTIRILQETLRLASGSLTAAVNLTGSSIDPATTLEVVNWNIEWFGSARMEPTNDNLQEQNVKTILQSLNADVYAVSEIVSEARLANVVSQMPGYGYVISNYGSHTNTTVNPPSALAEAQKLAFIYKTSVLSNISTTALCRRE